MLTGLMAILNAVCAAAAATIKAVPWWLWVGLAIFLAGGWVFHGGSCRDFACKRTPRPPRPARTYVETGVIESVEAANRFTISQGRRPVKRAVTVQYIVDGGDQAGADLMGNWR
jgi:hypothetical protein